MVAATVGNTVPGLLTDLTGDQFMQGVSLSLRPAFVAIRECVPAMRDGGAFAFISSTAAVVPFSAWARIAQAGGSGSPGARRSNDLGSRGYQFNVIQPGVVRTGRRSDLKQSARREQFPRASRSDASASPTGCAGVRYLLGRVSLDDRAEFRRGWRKRVA
jgi:NAD(P)-dependent dehydrogenase (short-subunit alcohol dehydrogenase family)